MTTNVTLVAFFAVAEAILLRLSQYALPEFYFATGSLFVRRAEVKWKAIVFRLAIPFTAGLVIALLPTDSGYLVASLSGGTAWFLVMWPIFWAPGVMVPPVEKGIGWIYVLWGVFWAAFALLPLSGLALMRWIANVLREPSSEWWKVQIASYLFLAVPVALGTLLFGRVAERRVKFFGDEPEDEEVSDGHMIGEGAARSRSWMEPAEWHFTAALFSVVLMPILLLGILIAIVRGRRGRPL